MSLDRPSPAESPPFRPTRPLVIGLSGGVASGKTTVAGMFAAHGLAVVDADEVARSVAEDPSVLAAVAAEFGAETVRDGHLDRPVLARLVFADPVARQRLEAIMHPPIRARIVAALAEHRRQGTSVLLDAPLLFEAGLAELCDCTVHVETSQQTRRQRAATRGWSEDELQRREAAQLPPAVKRQRASHIIANDDDLENTAREIAAVLHRIARAP